MKTLTKDSYKVIGLMSGTSLDGVDLVSCEFEYGSRWKYQIKHCKTIEYDQQWKEKLGNIHQKSAADISALDSQYGNFLGTLVNDFCRENGIAPDFISSHGHTIFHQPAAGFTKQIGSGAHLAAASRLPVVCDFRSVDVALSGQGAPLVPIGDRLLFEEYDFCLNLGGIANISFEKDGNRIASDLCACNLVLNHYASKKGLPYDKDGLLSKKGNLNADLLRELDELPYYSKRFPKSLGREDIERDILPLIDRKGLSTEDVMSTFCEHIGMQISKVTNQTKSNGDMLITGGGAYHSFVVDRIKKYAKQNIIVPQKEIIEFKEALIFAFLGVLRMRGEINCLKSVTGSLIDNCGGAVFEIS